MRIQFTVNQDEYQKLQNLAAQEGYPDVHTYCKDVALQVRTYATLWAKVKERIAKLPQDATFVLRDLVTTPPANLGRKLFENQKTLGITKVGVDNIGADKYKKL